VEQLSDLHALAQRRGDAAGFTARLRALLGRFSARPALNRRLERAGLDG